MTVRDDERHACSTTALASRKLGGLGHHREHDLQVAPGGGSHHRPQLQLEKRRSLQRHADTSPPHGRILLLRHAQVGQHLVGPDVQRSEHHRLAAGRRQHRRIVRGLHLQSGKASRPS